MGLEDDDQKLTSNLGKVQASFQLMRASFTTRLSLNIWKRRCFQGDIRLFPAVLVATNLDMSDETSGRVDDYNRYFIISHRIVCLSFKMDVSDEKLGRLRLSL